MPTSAWASGGDAPSRRASPLQRAPPPRAALNVSPCSGSCTTAASVPSPSRQAMRHGPLGNAVEEVDSAVERVDDPAEAARAGRSCALLAEHAVTRALLVQQADDERLGVAIRVRDGIGLRALELDAGRGAVEAVDQQRARRVRGPHGEVEQGVRIGGRQEWRGPDLNRRHPGFQPSALPAELPRRGPHQATTWPPLGSSVDRQPELHVVADRPALSSLAASPPLMQSAAAPARVDQDDERARRHVGERPAAPRGTSRQTTHGHSHRAACDEPRAGEIRGGRGQRAVAEAVDVQRRAPAGCRPRRSRRRVQAARERQDRRTAPSAPGGSPSARRPAAGAKTSRPWKVGEASGGTASSCAAATPPHRSAAGMSRPLSGPTNSLPSPPRERARDDRCPRPGR